MEGIRWPRHKDTCSQTGYLSCIDGLASQAKHCKSCLDTYIPQLELSRHVQRNLLIIACVPIP